MAFEVRSYPELSWSISRDKIFRECKRQYYYHYYGSHNGWLDDVTEETKQIYRLKHLTNLYLIFGESIHFIAENSINQWRLLKEFPKREELIASCKKNLNDAFKDSHLRSKWIDRPKKSLMLHEMYYDDRLPEKRTNDIRERLEPCIDNLIKSRTIRDITLTQDSSIMEVEQLKTFYILDDKLFVKLDLLYQDPIGRYVITDWKTGKEDENNQAQTLFYALYFKNQFPNVSLQQLRIRLEYLKDGECTEFEPTEEMLRWAKQQVIDSIEDMRLFIEDDNLNKPKHIEEFYPEPNKKACSSCNYREVCSHKI